MDRSMENLHEPSHDDHGAWFDYPENPEPQEQKQTRYGHNPIAAQRNELRFMVHAGASKRLEQAGNSARWRLGSAETMVPRAMKGYVGGIRWPKADRSAMDKRWG